MKNNSIRERAKKVPLHIKLKVMVADIINDVRYSLERETMSNWMIEVWGDDEDGAYAELYKRHKSANSIREALDDDIQ